MVTSGILVGDSPNNGPLEHGAVYNAHQTGIAASLDAHEVASLEVVIVAHIGTVATGHTARAIGCCLSNQALSYRCWGTSMDRIWKWIVLCV